MKQPSSGLLLIVSLAAVGALLVTVPPFVAAQYQALAAGSQTWANVYLATVGTGGALLVICLALVIWKVRAATLRKKRRRERGEKGPRDLSLVERQSEIAENLAQVDDLRHDKSVDEELRRELDPLIDEIVEKQEGKSLEIVAFGTVSSGKSSLLNALIGRDVFQTDPRGGTTLVRNQIPWPGQDQVALVDTPGLGEIDGAQRQELAAREAKDADLVLVVVDGPLRESEHELLELLSQMQKPVLICLNKADWYAEGDRDRLLGQITQQTQGMVDPANIVAVRSQPVARVRQRVLPDGTEQEETLDVAADIEPLARRMMQLVRRDGRDMLLANLLLRSRGLVETARQKVRENLDRRAWAVVDRYMWGAGGAGALSPFPIVDLVAGCGISAKMVVDLARIYRQEMDIDAATRLLGELGKTLIAIVGTSAVMPAITSVVASALKTVPGAGTIAGGVLQGLVLALVTRWIGGVFIEYFRNEMQKPPGGLTALARREWEKVTSVAELRRLIAGARNHLFSNGQAP